MFGIEGVLDRQGMELKIFLKDVEFIGRGLVQSDPYELGGARLRACVFESHALDATSITIEIGCYNAHGVSCWVLWLILANPVDDQHVQIQGYLLRQTAHDKYMFSDGTGEIVAEIKAKRLPAEPINEKTKVELIVSVRLMQVRGRRHLL